MQRGLEQHHELDPRLLLRDTRTIGQRIVDFFKKPLYVGVMLLTLAALAFTMPALADLLMVIGIACYFFCYVQRLTLPFRMPRRSGLMDYNDPLPGSSKPRQARGICFFGNSIATGEELWFTNDDMRTHVLIFGSTGSGKTEALISLAYNALLQSSGFIYVDGKGDNTLYAKIFSMVRRMGREDDLLLINFMTGARDIIGPQERRLSNTMNPFAIGSSGMLAQLVVSLMDSSSNSADGDMWKGRAISFVEALMRILVYARDQGWILLDANTIRNYFHLDRLEAMVMDKSFIRDEQEPVSLEGAPPVVMEPIRNYLFNLPGYNKEKKGKQVSQVFEQHGFITMQLTRVFSSLADTYGHIIRTNLAEVDFKDIVLNRRILVVLLPALEKSPEELSALGKIIVASLKAMMASGLGEDVEGAYHDVIERKPTNSATPFLCILDEYGYYAVPGFAVVPAQARSLGFSAIFAGQDLPAFQKASKEEAASIGANTNIKICMKMEDPIETWEFFSKTAGEAYVTKVDAFQTRPQSVLNNYMDTRSASSERRARIDLLDLKEQREGEAHIFFKSKIVRARMFYANPKPVKALRINHFLKIEKPDDKVLLAFERQLGFFVKALETENYLLEAAEKTNEEIQFIQETLLAHADLPPIEKGVAVLLDYYRDQAGEQVAEEQVEEDNLPESELNIFSKLRLSPQVQAVLLARDLENFGSALVQLSSTQAQIGVIERLAGKEARYANSVAAEIINDIQQVTHYPPEIPEDITVNDIMEVAQSLLAKIQQQRQQVANPENLFDDDD
jgi:intracellular multiplication protein IcmO